MANISFLATSEFEKEYKRLHKKYRSLPEDIKAFKLDFTNNPQMGDDLGNNIRKIRIAIKSKGKGKSGGARLIIYNLVVSLAQKNIILLTIYDKSELETISSSYIKEILNRNGFK